jgi:integrase
MARPATGQVLERHGKQGTTYGLRFRAYGERRYLTLPAGTTRAQAEQELQNVLADVRRGLWQPPAPPPVADEPRRMPPFHEFASEWVGQRKHEVGPRTVEHWTWLLSCHLLPAFAAYPLDGITVEDVDRYRTSKVRERQRSMAGPSKANSPAAQACRSTVQL